MCGEIGSSSGSRVLEIIFDLPFGFPINNIISLEYSFKNCKVVPMGKNPGVNHLKFLKTLGQTLGLDT